MHELDYLPDLIMVFGIALFYFKILTILTAYLW
jgi:hypothetical protein